MKKNFLGKPSRGGNSATKNETSEHKPQSTWNIHYPQYNNPYATNISLPAPNKSTDTSSNFSHPYIPGHYIVANITTTTESTTKLSSDETTTNPDNQSEEKQESLENHEPTLKPLAQVYQPVITKAPISRQFVRLRGGSKPSEGFLELQISSPGWGIVCDKENSWTIQEANIVCKQLGYER